MIKVGSRGSRLAQIQSELVFAALRERNPALEVQVVTLTTEGDRNRRASLALLGGRGVFVREIEERLLADEIDFAVHSLKDMPTTQPAGLVIAAVLERGDARDVLLSRSGLPLEQLPERATVGSSSQRRAAQVLALRPDLRLLDIRGNVDTRLRKMDEGRYDAIVLAAAGLDRLGLAGRVTQYFTDEEMLPAVGQGALAVECRSSDARTLDLLAPLDHAPTRAAVTAERSFLRGLGGGCSLPVAAHAVVAGGRLHLRGLVARPDGSRMIRREIAGEDTEAEALGMRLAGQVLDQGALELMETVRGTA